jgi:CubicO group peptidase (beta-lactamase class C family)
MNGTRKKSETWITVVVVAIGLPIAALVAFLAYVFNVDPIHASPEAVQSVMLSPPLPKWTGAVEQGQKIARARLVEQNLPGLSVAVGVAGEIVWAEGFGWANLEHRVPVSPAMRFRIGHVSKALTSAGVGLLREQGRLHLDEEIQTYVPAYPKKQWPVTLRQLMAHVGGVHHYRDTEWGDKPTAPCERASDGVHSFANDPLMFKPETRHVYSTYGWVLVSAAVEAAANEPFFSFMRAQVFTPLGMVDTEPDFPTDPMPNRATSYFRSNFLNETTTGVDYSCFAGGGAFLSTPSDLVRFGVGMSHLLQPSTVSMLQTPYQAPGVDHASGLGWRRETVELAGERTQVAGQASRTMEGASTSFLTFPDRGLVVVAMANHSFADMRSIALALAQAFGAAVASGSAQVPRSSR